MGNQRLPGLADVIQDWSRILGDKRVLVGETASQKYGASTSAVVREIAAALVPSNVDEVVALVKIAPYFWEVGAPPCPDVFIVDEPGFPETFMFMHDDKEFTLLIELLLDGNPISAGEFIPLAEVAQQTFGVKLTLNHNVPEPATVALMGLGLAGMSLVYRRRKQQRKAA